MEKEHVKYRYLEGFDQSRKGLKLSLSDRCAISRLNRRGSRESRIDRVNFRRKESKFCGKWPSFSHDLCSRGKGDGTNRLFNV